MATRKRKKRAFATSYGSAGGGSLHRLSAYNRKKKPRRSEEVK